VTATTGPTTNVVAVSAIANSDALIVVDPTEMLIERRETMREELLDDSLTHSFEIPSILV
jgi:hypothetical protein